MIMPKNIHSSKELRIESCKTHVFEPKMRRVPTMIEEAKKKDRSHKEKSKVGIQKCRNIGCGRNRISFNSDDSERRLHQRVWYWQGYTHRRAGKAMVMEIEVVI